MANESHDKKTIVFKQNVGGGIIQPHGKLKARKRIVFFVKETIQGWFPSGDPKLKKGVDITMIVDKELKEYHHIVKNTETGEIIHEEHESLEQHNKKTSSRGGSHGHERQKERQETQGGKTQER
jgi:hypothetical protein